MTKIYGQRGEPSDITVETCVNSISGTNEYAAVRIDNPAVPHTFVLKPEQIRAKIHRVREHSDDEQAGEEFADRLEEAIEAAEAMEV